MKRIILAFSCFFRVLFNGDFAQKVANVNSETTTPESENSYPLDAVALLALLQEEGRLVDFLQEDIAEYDDEQVGAAVRDIHKNCSTTLNKFFTIAPTIIEKEEDSITVEEGFDPGEVKLIGNVSGQPPFQGTVKHHGWKVTNAKGLPKLLNDKVILPAEVEI